MDGSALVTEAMRWSAALIGGARAITHLVSKLACVFLHAEVLCPRAEALDPDRQGVSDGVLASKNASFMRCSTTRTVFGRRSRVCCTYDFHFGASKVPLGKLYKDDSTAAHVLRFLGQEGLDRKKIVVFQC